LRNATRCRETRSARLREAEQHWLSLRRASAHSRAPSARTHSTTMCALLRLPFDILDHLVETLERPDLLCLALSCSTWKNIIIPYHLEYREVSLSVDHHSIWRHLAERPSLAANVRKLVITEPDSYYPTLSFMPVNCFRWQVPTTLVPLPSDTLLPEQQRDYPLRALRNMRLLKTLEFENISRWSQGSPDTLSLVLAHIPSVEKLVLRSSRTRGVEVEGDFKVIQVSTSAVY
jgi:F-box domain